VLGGGIVPATEKNFRRSMGWKDLWQMEAILGRKAGNQAGAPPVAA
jgi:hypothetical protein